MPVALERDEAVCVVRLEGEINIASAAGLKATLLQALAAGTDVRLHLERASGLEVTALQLLWAAERQARGAGNEFTVAGPLPEAVVVASSEAGFEKFPLAVSAE